MKILHLDENHPFLLSELLADGHTCVEAYELSREEILEEIGEYEGLLLRSRTPVDKEFIDAAKKLKFVARVGSGMENIDVKYAESKGIVCLHTPEGLCDAVAEHALGMLLALLNNICRANREVRSGLWRRAENRGTEIGGQTIGIIGYGHTGKAFARVLSGFGAKILAYDKYNSGFGNDQVKETSMEEIFAKADIVSLHIPQNEETLQLVNSRFLDSFAKPIILINTSRGKIVKLDDLVEAMKSGQVTGACLDVLEYENASFEGLFDSEIPETFAYLSRHDRVVMTPHVAGWSHQSKEKMARIIVEKIRAQFPS
jgi:D-3-phosphoglycerate dehydrogenase / 2-oxoglutarate reductase